MGEFFPKFWENTKFFPNFSDKFVPKIGESPNLSSNFGTNSSPNLVNPQISPQLSGQIRPQIWWFPKFVLKFGENFFPKFGESPNLSPNFGTNSSPNLGNPQICPQISGQIRPQICPQKAREHTSKGPTSIHIVFNLPFLHLRVPSMKKLIRTRVWWQNCLWAGLQWWLKAMFDSYKPFDQSWVALDISMQTDIKLAEL